MSDLNPFISEFCRWAAQRGLPKNGRARLSAALRKAIEVELPARDDKIQVDIMSLQSSDKLRCTYKSQDIWLFYGLNNLLNVAVVSPYWLYGWGKITKDEMLASAIGDFFHFARSYIVYGRIFGLIGAIALTYGKACEFRYGPYRRHSTYSKDPHKPI